MPQVQHTQSIPLDDLTEAITTNLARKLPLLPLYAGRIRPELGAINVCGNGPSLRTRYPSKGPIVALNGAWRALAKHGITPDYIVAYDPAPENVAWFKDAPLKPTYLLGSRLHPGCFDLLKQHQVFMWHTHSDPERNPLKLEPLIGGGHTVGATVLNLLAAMGYQHFDLWGYDSCFGPDGAHHATQQGWALEPPKLYTVGGNSYLSSAWMIGQVERVVEQIFVNRHDYSVKIHDGGMLAAVVEEQTLEVVYNLDVAPGSFDFIHSLNNVMHFMQQYDYCQLRVHFKPGTDKGFRPNEPIFVSHAGKTRMLNHVVRPMLSMFGAVEVPAVTKELEFSYSPAQSLARYRSEQWMPSFQANYAARKWAWENYPDKPVVITLRECDHWPQRNSDTYEWLRFARYLGKSKRVVFLRDTDCVGQPFEFETCDEASLDLHKRLALYRRASMCFFVMNGPASLAYYTQDIPYAVFLTSAPGYPCYDPQWLQRFLGIDPYGQFPWANLKRQRLVYADDDLDLIKKAYGELANE